MGKKFNCLMCQVSFPPQDFSHHLLAIFIYFFLLYSIFFSYFMSLDVYRVYIWKGLPKNLYIYFLYFFVFVDIEWLWLFEWPDYLSHGGRLNNKENERRVSSEVEISFDSFYILPPYQMPYSVFITLTIDKVIYFLVLQIFKYSKKIT